MDSFFAIELEESVLVGAESQEKTEKVLCAPENQTCSPKAQLNTLRMKFEKLNADMRRLKEKKYDPHNLDKFSLMVDTVEMLQIEADLSLVKEYLLACIQTNVSKEPNLELLVDALEKMATELRLKKDAADDEQLDAS